MCKVYVRYVLVFLFGPGRNRTTDTRIFNPLPYSTKPQGLIHQRPPTVVLNDTCRPLEADNTVDPPKPNLTQRVLRIACPFKGHPSRPQTKENFYHL